MRKKSCLMLLVLVFALLNFIAASVQAQTEDSVVVDTIIDVAGDATVTVNVRLKTDSSLSAVVIPLTFKHDNNLAVQCDSIQWSEDWFWANEPNLYAGQGGDLSYIDNTEKTIRVYAQWFMDTLPAKDDTLFTIYFSTETYWNPDTAVKIDTFRVQIPPNWLKLVGESASDWIPGFSPGFLGNPTWVREVDAEDVYLPQEFALGQNYPNPFNPTTMIRFALPEDDRVKIEVFNILGQKITTLVDEFLTAGYKETGWDGRDSKGIEVASGIYFYRIATDKFTDIKKMVLLK